jgi:hypothetical protein
MKYNIEVYVDNDTISEGVLTEAVDEMLTSLNPKYGFFFIVERAEEDIEG